MAGKLGKSSIANFFVRKRKHEEIDLESDAAVTPVVHANIESVHVPVAIEADVTIVIDTPALRQLRQLEIAPVQTIPLRPWQGRRQRKESNVSRKPG